MVELETRECAGGCGNRFKVMPTSSIRHARKDCEYVCQGKKKDLEKIKRDHIVATSWTGDNFDAAVKKSRMDYGETQDEKSKRNHREQVEKQNPKMEMLKALNDPEFKIEPKPMVKPKPKPKPKLKTERRYEMDLKDGQPCQHPGCLSHVSHPCEGCHRIGGRKMKDLSLPGNGYLLKSLCSTVGAHSSWFLKSNLKQLNQDDLNKLHKLILDMHMKLKIYKRDKQNKK